MESHITNYVKEMLRQADILEWADERDHLAISIIQSSGDRPRKPGRRIWTRQDKNRLEVELIAAERWRVWEQGNGPQPLFLEDIPNTRISTRVERILSRLPKIREFHFIALAEAENRGIHAIVSPLLVACLKAHEYLLDYFIGDKGIEWGKAERRHRTAIKNIEEFLPPDPLTQPMTRSGTRDFTRLLTTEEKRNRISIDYQAGVVTLDEVQHRVEGNALDLIKALIDANGEWINGSSIDENFKPRRACKKLPKEIQSLIESQSGKGYRINMK